MSGVRRLLAIALVFAGSAAIGADCDGWESASLHQHVLDRTGFGPDAWSRERIARLGARRYILEQLHPDAIPDDEFQARIDEFPPLAASYAELSSGTCAGCDDLDPDAPLHRAIDAKILRSISSRRQLEAVLEDFWFDHFNVDARRGLAMPGLIPYLRDAIRPHVLGRFEDLLLAVARSPAMLDYLDNRRSFRDGSVGGDGIVRGINENFARELLELHTVGPASGFSQRDVREVARIFTGWTTDGDGFRFKARDHDQGAKQVLGVLDLQAGGGVEEGERLIGFLAAHPASAERISRLLIRRLVSEEPPEDLVRLATRTFRGSHGNLRAVVRTILLSQEFWNPRTFGAKVKRPAVLLASAVRATGALQLTRNLIQLRKDLGAMGEATYQAPTPAGYPDDSRYWANAGTFIKRLAFVHRVAQTGSVEWPSLRAGASLRTSLQLGDRLFVGGVTPHSLLQVHEFFVETSGEPERRRVAEAVALLLSSPDFFQH
jgi:uncharacterized protein (DUF1800 family)